MFRRRCFLLVYYRGLNFPYHDMTGSEVHTFGLVQTTLLRGAGVGTR